MPRTACRTARRRTPPTASAGWSTRAASRVAGAYSSDNAITVAPLANELQVPLISWAGTDRLQGDYCFRLGNGDVGGDAALVVAWLKKQGYERVAVLSEISPNGEEYFRYFRQECPPSRHLRIAAVETVTQSPGDLAENLESLRAGQPDALVYMGYGMLAAQGPAARSARRARAGTRPASWAPRSCST